MTDVYEEKVKFHNNQNLSSYSGAEEIIRLWNYNDGEEIPLGEFYQVSKSVYEDEFPQFSDADTKKYSVKEFMEKI
jgi:hypothetical protein